MKKNLLLLFLLGNICVHAQNYNNEWIDYSKTYYKFKVGADRLYRITQPALASLGLQNTPAEHFQLWRNGKEVAIYTTAQTGVFGASDYIEFWGEMNDGKPDRDLYRNPNHQLNDRWSLATDTAAFFLTVNTGSTNLRFVPEANNLPSALPAEPFFMHKSASYYKNRMNPGLAAVVGEYLHSSTYDEGEGWASALITTSAIRESSLSNNYSITYGVSPNLVFNNLFVYPTGPTPSIKISVSGNALYSRQYKVSLNGDSVTGGPLNVFNGKTDESNFPLSLISATNSATINVTNWASVSCPPIPPGQPAPACAIDRMMIHKIEMTYPRIFNFGNVNNFLFELPATNDGNNLEIAGFAHSNIQPVLYDLTNNKRYVATIGGSPSLVRVALPPSAVARKLLLVTQAASYPLAITSFEQRNFVDFSLTANQGDYLIITHPAMTTSSDGSNPVEDYKAYRSSPAGGGHSVSVSMADEVIDQFGFGIKKNPLGIRNFIWWARNHFPNTITNVFLIGKGLTYNQNRSNEANANINSLSFVPTFGHPASDNLFTVNPTGSLVPQVPIGRLSVINGDEVRIYLDKVVQYEQQQASSSPFIGDKAWMKNAVNVIGASDVTLGAILTEDMNRYRNIISDTFYSANVSTFSKVTAAPVEQANSEKLYGLFEEGIGLMTYFGHSSASTLEFNLDNPDQYNNPSKYPITIVMGCNAGNFYNFNTLRLQTRETLSEKFVLANQRGSIAFVASTHFGIVHYLDILNTQTMISASVTKYGKSLGEILNESIARTYNITTQNDYYARFHCEQVTIHGDPAIKMNGSTEKPDYVIEDQLLKISPGFISVAETHFNVQAKFINLGKSVNKPIVVEVKRTYPDLTTEVIRRDTMIGIRYSDSLSYDIPIVATRDKGLNKISICVDADNMVDELYETNNCITKDVIIFEDEARPVFPYTYSIVRKQDIKLVASTANPFSELKQYTLEIDTTEFFNSPVKSVQSINSTGGVLEFNPGIAFTDSTVYYWRVAPVPTTGEPVWNKSSFVFLSPTGPNASEAGFNQSHFYQHTKSSYERMYIDSAQRKHIFDDVYHNLFLRMGTWVTSGATQESALSVSVDGIPYIRLCSWFQSLVFNVLDPVSFKAWENAVIEPAVSLPDNLGKGRYGSHAPQNLSQSQPYIYNFEYRYTSPEYRKRMMDFVKDTIPDGHYVIVRNFTLNPATSVPPNFPVAYASDWAADEAIHGPGQSIYHYLKDAGFAGIDSFYRPRPWGLVYKKNDPSFAPRWLVGDGLFDNPTFSVDCPTVDTLGYITSPLFGPAKAWKQLKWRGDSDDVTPGDITTISVIGVRQDGTESILFNSLTTLQQDVDVSSINAAIYPFVKLQLRTEDNINFTPYQLRYWRLTYDPVPEGAVAPNIYFSLKDTVDVGEPIDFKVAFKNISEAAFDSLKVKVLVTDRNNVPHVIPANKLRPLLVNDTLQLVGTLIPTENIPGLNTVYIEANPDNDQPEQYHFNNFAFKDVYVKPDSLNPLLDVTFDGVHILNRDIVSSKPDIQIKLKDEARWMLLNDTSLATIEVRYPDNSIRRFYFNNTDTLTFTPVGQAPATDNTASINLKPYFEQDGEYELIVTGKDRSGNSSGNVQYRVLFEVINKPMISNMLNYPNPFTTSTAFVFTITGSEVPQNIKIEIMTITGKIVREITKDELGPLHIGRNITEFKWDGTDQYGQKLANGVYLYRVVTNLNGKSLDKYKSANDNTDKYFNKGYGKMYLMR